MKKKNKNILIILVIGIVLIVSIFFSLNKKEYHELPKVKIKDDINKSGLAIMVEKDYQTGEYQQSNSTIFPTDGYTLNRIKSGCVDKNGKDVDALTYNESDKTISIKTKQSVYCYLYYDNLFKGKGTEEEPYQINYIEDLVRLSNSVNNDLNTYQDKNFILTRNLDFNENASYMKYNDTGFGDINGVNNIEGIKDELTNKEGTGFIPISTSTTRFQGNFDGNNKRLDNIYEENKNDTNNFLGLFKNIENSTIKNLTISGNINTKVNTVVGGLIGLTYGDTIIDNCINEVNANNDMGTNSVGGIVGEAYGNLTMTNSMNKGQISGGNNTGGLIGANNNTITIDNSHNEGRIINEVGNYAGGLVGRDSSATSKAIIKKSYNVGEVTNSKNSEGGLVGLIRGTIEIDNSYNDGNITGNLGLHLGGLIGNADSQSNITINNSYNNKNIVLNKKSTTYYIGGIIGLLNGTLTINNSYNKGNIMSDVNENHSYFGGIIGDSFGIFKMNNVYNEGNIGDDSLKNSARVHSGGLVGALSNYNGDILEISNCYNRGTVIGNYKAGGLVGMQTTAKLIINESYNKGNVIGGDSGGIAGHVWKNGSLFIINSYNSGVVSGVSVGGIYGQNGSGTNVIKIMNSYNLGTVNIEQSSSNNVGGGIFGNVSAIHLNNIYNAGDITGNSTLKYGIGNLTTPTFQNIYYKTNISTGTNLENDGELTTPMEETDMKSKTFVDTLNKNVDELNNAGLENIDENLKGYELEKWGIKVNSYPVLTRKIEDLSGSGNHGLSYAVKYDEDGVTTSTDENNLGYIDAGLRGHDFGNNFTMVIKFKFNSILDSNYLFGNWEMGGMGIAIRNINGTMNVTEAIYTDKWYSFNKPYDFKENEWYTMVLIYDGSLVSQNLKIYINGQLHDTISVTGNIKIPNYNLPIIIGADPSYAENIASNTYTTFKETLIFDRALTEEKDHISTNYKDDINVTNQDELLLWYKF